MDRHGWFGNVGRQVFRSRSQMLFISPGDGPERQRCLSGNGSPVLGDRLANLRNEVGFTQQDLAERIAISRVALSNLESGRSIPGERTVALLAGVFGLEPHELVAGTAYPTAKMDRLPLTTNRYSEAQMQILLMERDLQWLSEIDHRRREEVIRDWTRDLTALRAKTHDAHDRQLVADAIKRLGLLNPDRA
ncbi:MAG: helix-turn-helix transcriptional regulator [Microthrixaceae bacterium]